MKNINLYMRFRGLIHLLFWMISVIYWTIAFDPFDRAILRFFGKNIFGISISPWFPIVLMTCILYLLTLLPFIWLVKNVSRRKRIILSLVFVLILSIMILEFTVPSNFFFFYHQYLYVVIFHLPLVFAVYFNLNVLIKKLLSQNRPVLYFLALIALITGSSYANNFLFDHVIDPVFPKLYFISYLDIRETILVTALYLFVTTIVYLIWDYVMLLKANKEKFQYELSTLKSQINPHFLFNNMNTIYNMASVNDPRTKDVILQLSDFLRYVLYDTSSDEIPLEKEIETIQTYVGLQKERLNALVTSVDLTVRGDFEHALIAPLLLLPLAENCFKHGLRKEGGKIRFDIGFDGKSLRFSTENPVARYEAGNKSKYGGIGISNVKKRLDLLYPNRHEFRHEEKDGFFRVELAIILW